MKVELINLTTFALETLLYTKNTRLQGAKTFEDVCNMPTKEKMEHLDYMRDTIQSSWEFVDYTFKISGVSRAFTHQLVRTRTGSYAQESQRTVDVRWAEVINPAASQEYDNFAAEAMNNYQTLIDNGMAVQNARGLLPTNVETSIIAKFSLRTLHDMALLRLCTRTQGEYQEVFKAMRDEVVKIHPWAKDFIKVHCAWYGSCAFPRYKECPVKMPDDDRHDQFRKDHFEKGWENVEHEAVPVAKGGMTQ